MEVLFSFGKSILLGFILGIVMGFFLKGFIKILLVIVVLVVVAVYFGISKGWINPDWFSFSMVPEFSMPKSWNLDPALNLLFSNIPLGIGAIVGFFVGVKKG